MTREEELDLIQTRINEETMQIWNALENETKKLCAGMKHVRMTSIAVFVVTGNEPGIEKQRLYAVASAADARMNREEIDMILAEATESSADTVVRKEVRPQ